MLKTLLGKKKVGRALELCLSVADNAVLCWEHISSLHYPTAALIDH